MQQADNHMQIKPKLMAALLIAIVLAAGAALTTADTLDHALLMEAEPRNFEQLVAARTIRVLVSYNKTNYFFDGATQRGVSYDLMKLFEEQLNKDLERGHLQVHISFLPVPRDQLIPALLAGKGDIIAANMTISPQRQALVAFSEPMLSNVQELIATRTGHPAITDSAGLADLEIHVRRSSSYYESLKQVQAELIASNKTAPKMVLADERLEDEDLLEMVHAGLIPATIVDSHKANFWLQVYPELQVHEQLPLRSGGQIAYAFRKDSPLFEQHINKFVNANRKGSLMGNILFKRYLKNTRYIHNSLTSAEMKKFAATTDFFKKYATEYDFDWLMLTAQGYQESRLNQDTRSAAGAVGIMQLLPTTAADRHVNIEDISSVENNIHAGAKYMSWLRDTYFTDPDMTPIDQTLFAFAAYNAGPGRVARLRKEAASMGLDPNVWFNNVEVVAAKRIGRETVQYVSNIYKYWVAYTLAQRRAS
jgi:membrane-bound lytic murein transglycosylase MltF